MTPGEGMQAQGQQHLVGISHDLELFWRLHLVRKQTEQMSEGPHTTFQATPSCASYHGMRTPERTENLSQVCRLLAPLGSRP